MQQTSFIEMIDTPRITQSVAQTAAVLHLTISRGEIRTAMGPGSHHLRLDPDTFDFEIGVPVATPIAPAGRVQPGQLPAVRVARTFYHGSYEGLGEAWGQLMSWIETSGLTPGPDFWEVYSVGPEGNSDQGARRTELNRPLR